MTIYLTLFLVFLFLPGLLFYRIAFRAWPDYLTAFSLSFGLFMVNLSLLSWLYNSPSGLTAAATVEILLLAALLVVCKRWRKPNYSVQPTLPPHYYWGQILVVLGVFVYLYFSGIYMEVPADFWRHLARIQDAHEVFKGDRQYMPHAIWYYLPAWFWFLSGDDVHGFIRHYGTFNTLIHCLGIYVFSYGIAAKLTDRNTHVVWIAILAVLISAFSLGVNVFSYVRYYTFAPTLHNFLIYLCCVRLALEVFEQNQLNPKQLAILGFLTGCMFLVQQQEVAFLFALMLSVSAVTVVGSLNNVLTAPTWIQVKGQVVRNRGLIISLVFLCFFLSLFFYSRYNLPVQGRLSPWVIPLSSLLPIGDHIYIADPGFQIYAATTLWGLWVYILFLLNWKTFKHNLYIVSAMAIPVVTVFNPAFVDLFIRYSIAPPIYRFIYVVPLALVAAIYVVFTFGNFFKKRWIMKIAHLASFMLLIGLLFPFDVPFATHYSRLHTLSAVPEGNEYTHWSDLFQFLNTIDKAIIFTDSVTAYMIKGLSNHRAGGYKFHRPTAKPRHTVAKYAQSPGSLVIINTRDGDLSVNGRLSRHWPKDVLKLSDRYSDGMQQFIQQNPNLFQLVWNRDRIRVYRILKLGKTPHPK